MTCVNGEPHVTSPVDFIGDHGPEVVECVTCRREFVIEHDGTLVPVDPPSAVELALETRIESRNGDDRAGAWDSYHDGLGLMADPHWAGLDEPR